jgi:hypothetical protein
MKIDIGKVKIKRIYEANISIVSQHPPPAATWASFKIKENKIVNLLAMLITLI